MEKCLEKRHVFNSILRLRHHMSLLFVSIKNNMKVVISKSGLAVPVPKNANISGTILAMKIQKLGLCRGRLGISCPIKI